MLSLRKTGTYCFLDLDGVDVDFLMRIGKVRVEMKDICFNNILPESLLLQNPLISQRQTLQGPYQFIVICWTKYYDLLESTNETNSPIRVCSLISVNESSAESLNSNRTIH